MFVDTKVRPQGEPVDAIAPSKLKLSEAIRIGAKIRPQAFGRAFRQGKSCAWGAAWEGSGHSYDENEGYCRIFTSNSEWVKANIAITAACGNTIALLNDNRVSREEIANMLESLGL